MVSLFLLYLSVKRATGLLVFLYYFVLPSLNKAITYLLTKGWKRLTRIANDEIEKFRLNFSRCGNSEMATSRAIFNIFNGKWKL